MCKAVEDYGKIIAKEEQEKNIAILLKKGMSPEWIHDAFSYPMELIEQIQEKLN